MPTDSDERDRSPGFTPAIGHNSSPIADDFSTDIREIVIELFRTDSKRNRRKVYYLISEAPADQRMPGLFKLGGRVCLVRSVFRQGLIDRAKAATAVAALALLIGISIAWPVKTDVAGG